MNGTYVIGSVAGAESVTIVITDMPSHSHQMQGSASAASSTVPTSNAPGAATINIYAPPSSTVQTASITTNSPASGGLPHDNIQPYVALNYVIALDGIYPSQG
jgi:microcystin-dependent protein